jgi:hypothetical protein
MEPVIKSDVFFIMGFAFCCVSKSVLLRGHEFSGTWF